MEPVLLGCIWICQYEIHILYIYTHYIHLPISIFIPRSIRYRLKNNRSRYREIIRDIHVHISMYILAPSAELA